MNFLTDAVMAFGRIMGSTLGTASNMILGVLEVFDSADPDAGDQTTDSSDEEPIWGQMGFYCRPPPPSDQANKPLAVGAAEHFSLRWGDGLVPVATRDLRLTKQVNPSVGAVGMAHWGGGFCEMGWNDDEDGTSITIYALRKTSTGEPDKASVITLDSTAASANITLRHESGSTVSMSQDGHITLIGSGGKTMIHLDESSKETQLSGDIVRTTGFTVLGSIANPAADLTVQELVKKRNFDTWSGEVNSAIAALKTALTTINAPAGGGACTVTDGSTAPTTVVEYTEAVKAK